ncbi:protein kinase domain-containing protein [Rhodopseudomonas palustris]|uniref:protein kinase domain-containing protein n=1 Tax=Rhodopseudomonas palustris TaxID=1076 RepID=UPI00130498EF|nr:SIR2 family protein [Rhodopseudomonas palustris]
MTPDSLDGLARAYAEKKTGAGLIFFIGSGPSTDAGLPDWQGLRNRLTRVADHLIKQQAIRDELQRNNFEKLKLERDYWKAFSLLKVILGSTTFPQEVRKLLTPPAGAAIPEVYKELTVFDLRGIITTNIDDLLLKAFSKFTTKLVKPVYGKDIFDRLEILQRERPFFFQMHGDIAAEKTWIFTDEDRTQLLQSEAHRRFLDTVFFTTTVVFLGISPDDVSVSGRLLGLKASGSPTAPHYWITADINSRRRDWAEENGIQQIVYPSVKGHTECISKILKYVRNYKSLDENIERPSINTSNAHISERDPTKLAQLDDIDLIRQSLNGIILENRDDQGRISFERYSEICRTYRRAVAIAYLQPSNADEEWFGHRVEATPLGGKTFGTVYSARTSDDEIVAIKILQEQRFRDAAYLSSFRRGAEALRILNEYAAPGVARFRESYELPPTLIMDFESGASLDQLVPAGKLKVDAILDVILACANIVRFGHSLPQTVMHRDIKPSNILLRDFSWEDSSYSAVVMFDFDLGWFKGAYGEEATRTDPDSLGFQAPEQLSVAGEPLRRSTLVDSFGLGATLYFSLSRSVPMAGASGAEDWERKIDGACRRAFPNDRVAERRCARLILNCTSSDQRERPDFSLIVDALEDLINWRRRNTSKCSTEFIAEALVSLSSDSGYEWDSNRLSASHNNPSGMAIRSRFDPLENTLVLEFNFQDPKIMNRRNLDRRISEFPAFFKESAQQLDAVSHEFKFSGTREMFGSIRWNTTTARERVVELGTFSSTVAKWFSGV